MPRFVIVALSQTHTEGKTMKITNQDYAHLSKALDTIRSRIIAAAPQYRAAGLSDKRMHWDSLRAAGLMPWLCDTLYEYLDDGHVDTALRYYFLKLKC